MTDRTLQVMAAVDELVGAFADRLTLNERISVVDPLVARIGALMAEPPGQTFTAATAYKMPQPRGYVCAAGCKHGTTVHREHGCDVDPCDCPAPYGRILPSAEAGRENNSHGEVG